MPPGALQLLRSGAPQTWACKAIQISPETLESYRERAATKEEPFASFVREAEQAEAEYVLSRLRVLDADGVGAPTGDKRERGNGDVKWLLERLHPKDFALVTRNEVTGKDGAPFEPPRAGVIIMPPKDPE